MDLVERYIQAVQWWLPSKQKQDLVAELADDLQSQIEAQEGRVGRPLTEAETADLLERCGHPLTIAGRYLPQPTALDPVLWVLYRFVLKVVLLWVLAPVLVLVLVPPVLTAAAPGSAVLEALLQAWQAAMYATGTITIAFALVRRLGVGSVRQDAWDPRRLPRLRDAGRIPRASSAAEVAADLLFLCWWTGLASFLVGFDGARLTWSPGPVWEQFHRAVFWPVLMLAAAHAALAAFNLLRPYWTRLKLTLRAIVNGAMAGVLVLGLRPHWQEFLTQCQDLSTSPAALSTSEGIRRVTSVSIFSALLVVVAIVGVIAVVDGVRALLWRPASLRGLPPRAALPSPPA